MVSAGAMVKTKNDRGTPLLWGLRQILPFCHVPRRKLGMFSERLMNSFDEEKVYLDTFKTMKKCRTVS